jgi:hypothetical protein
MRLTLHGCPWGQSLLLEQTWKLVHGVDEQLAFTAPLIIIVAQQNWLAAQLAGPEHDKLPPAVRQDPFGPHDSVHDPDTQQSCESASQVVVPHWMRPGAIAPASEVAPSSEDVVESAPASIPPAPDVPDVTPLPAVPLLSPPLPELVCPALPAVWSELGVSLPDDEQAARTT